MTFKLNISHNGKAWKIEGGDLLAGKSVGERVDGKIIKPELAGYELEITGGTDSAGFPISKNVEGIGLRRVILTRGWGMRENTKGLRRRKTVRGKIISEQVSQINMNVVKEGVKKLEEIFPEQNLPKEKKTAEKAEATQAEK